MTYFPWIVGGAALGYAARRGHRAPTYPIVRLTTDKQRRAAWDLFEEESDIGVGYIDPDAGLKGGVRLGAITPDGALAGALIARCGYITDHNWWWDWALWDEKENWLGPPKHPERTCDMSAVVAPAHRRRGIARAMIIAAMEYFQQSPHPIYLVTEVAEPKLIPVLRQLGFRRPAWDVRRQADFDKMGYGMVHAHLGEEWIEYHEPIYGITVGGSR